MEFIPLRLKGTSGRILDSRGNFFTKRWSGIGRRWWSPHPWTSSRNNSVWNSVIMEGFNQRLDSVLEVFSNL